MNPRIHHERLDELIEDARETMHLMLDQALASRALTQDMRSTSTYLLARSIITIYGDQRNHAPPSPSYERDIKHLANSI